MNAIGYVRVSTAQQADTGLSLDAQRQAVAGYCTLHELLLSEVIADEGESAKSIAGRPGMSRLVELIKAGQIGHIVVLKMDRLFRNTRQALELFGIMERRGVEFHSVREKIDTGTAMGRFFRTTMLAMAEFEREQVGERTAAVLRATKLSPGGSCILDYRKQAGKLLVGQAPYGWRWEAKDLVLDQDEMPVVLRIRAMRAAGATYSDMQAQLRDGGIVSRLGRPWSRMTLRRICAADYYPDHEREGALQ